MKSLRARLFILLISATLAVWSAAAVWTYFSTRADVQRVLDRRLVEAAGMVSSLVQDSSGAISRPAPVQIPAGDQNRGYSRQLSCQIWTLDWRLVGRSSSAPTAPLAAEGQGFSERSIQGERWRVYTLIERKHGLRILVGDNLSVRRNLVSDVLAGLLLPALVGLIALGVLIWSAIGRALVPIRRVAGELGKRHAGETDPLRTANADVELRPLVDAINDLFARLEILRANERHFVASAAHELQTPLAGLKAHSQIALAANDAETRERSLRSIQASVDRTSRLVQQLLDLSREEAEGVAPAVDWRHLGRAVNAVADEFAPILQRQHLTIRADDAVLRTEILIDEAGLLLCLRNLIGNAVEHAPTQSEIQITVEPKGGFVDVAITDEGAGIPPAEMQNITKRFVRGSRAKGLGSGLGLSIVELVLERADATLDLTNRVPSGLRAGMRFPAPSVRITSEANTP